MPIKVISAILLFASACSSPPSTLSMASPDAALVQSPDASPDAQPSADLSLDMGRTQIDLSVATEHFLPSSCELQESEQCVAAAGDRKLLRFSVETINLGDSDLRLGIPGENPNFTLSECHGHYHFDGYANYRLLNDLGSAVVVGRKQAFCLLDSEPYTPEASTTGIYTCFNQGLQAGWADVYSADLPCQFLDITDIPDGDYTLEVEVNPEGLLADASSSNNVGTMALRIGDPALDSPSEDCPDLDGRYLNRIEKECGWDFAGDFECTPGTQTGAGCSQNCGRGSCTGDPMIRVCDALESNCTSATSLGRNDNRCGGACPMATNFLCPPSGMLAVYTASADHSQPYSCDLAIGPGPDQP